MIRPSFVASAKTTKASGFFCTLGFQKIESIWENTAVHTPIPSARMSAATAVKPGFFRSLRQAKRRSFMDEGENIEHRTANVERRSSGSPFGRTFDVRRSVLDVRCSSYS